QKIQKIGTNELLVKYAIELMPPDENDMCRGSDPENGLLEVRRLPTGFLRISRNAIQRMINECTDVPEYEIDDRGKPLTINRLFSFDYIDKQEVSEDFRFCDRWRSIGGQVWCDPELTVNHHGQVTFHGHFGNFMRELQAREKLNEKLDAQQSEIDRRMAALDKREAAA